MQFIRSILFTILFYLALILVFIIALPTLILPSKATLICGKILAHIIIFLLRFVLGVKVTFSGTENLKKNVEIWGSGKPKREVMYVDDLASAITFILEKKISKNKKLNKYIKLSSLINVGSGQEFTIREFAEKIKKLTFSKKKLKYNKKYPDGTKRKVLNINFMSDLGWKSKISLNDGLKDTINWYKNNDIK